MSDGGATRRRFVCWSPMSEAGVRRIFTRLLSRAEMEVTEACDGPEAWASWKRAALERDLERHHDAEPVRGGAAQAVRERDTTTQVIFATSNPSLETAMRAVELGTMRYLTKADRSPGAGRDGARRRGCIWLALIKQEAMTLIGSKHPLAVDGSDWRRRFAGARRHGAALSAGELSVKSQQICGAMKRCCDRQTRASRRQWRMLEAAERLG